MKEERVSRNHKERNSISWETCHKLGQKKGEQKKERKLLQFRPDGNFWYEGFSNRSYTTWVEYNYRMIANSILGLV